MNWSSWYIAMAVPKSVTKVISKNGVRVEFKSNVNKTEYYLFELCRAALRDVAKFVRKEFIYNFNENFRKRTGTYRKGLSSRVFSGKDTKYPRVDMGLSNRSSKGFYAFFQEVGTLEIPRLGLLQHAVEDNVETIVQIESQYLSALNSSENSIEKAIDESEYEESE